VGWSGWRSGLAQKTVRSDLTAAGAAMQGAKNFGSGYPTSLPSSFKPGNDVTITYKKGDAQKYCIEAVSKIVSSVSYFIDSTTGSDPVAGTCTLQCNSGDSLSGSTCTHTYVATYNAGTGHYTCPSGGTLSGTNCTYAATATPGCPANYTYNATAAGCLLYLGSTAAGGVPGDCSTLYPTTNYVAGGDTSLRIPWRCYNKVASSGTTYSCPSGGTLGGTNCTYTATYVVDTPATYTCNSGDTLTGTNCASTYPAY
jgi:hypothetical protein